MKLGAVEFLAEALCLARQEDRLVGFAVEDEYADCDETADNEDYPHVPSPACALSDEAAADGAQNGPKKNAQGVDRDGFAALLGYEHVGDDTSSDGQTSAAADASEESHADETTKVGRKCTSKRKGAEEEIGAVQDNVSAVDF